MTMECVPTPSRRVWSLHPQKLTNGFVPMTLAGHKDSLVACFFDSDGGAAYTIAKDCAIFVWVWQTDADHPNQAAKKQRQGGNAFSAAAKGLAGSAGKAAAAVLHARFEASGLAEREASAGGGGGGGGA